MKILSEMPTAIGWKWVLIDYGNNFYGYGFERDLHSLYGFPVNQCGTKDEVVTHCKSIAELCRQNIEKYKREFTKDKHDGWEVLIEGQQKELEILTEFIRILEEFTEKSIIKEDGISESIVQKLYY